MQQEGSGEVSCANYQFGINSAPTLNPYPTLTLAPGHERAHRTPRQTKYERANRTRKGKQDARTHRTRKGTKKRLQTLRTTVSEKMAASYSPALHCSTIGAGGLNFSVRNGKRWDPAAITT